MQVATEHIRSLVERELRSAQRYQRFFAVIVVVHEQDGCGFRNLFSSVLRDCDAILENDSYTVILMEETDQHGAMAAMKRLEASYGGLVRLRFGAASYPKDSRDAGALLAIALSRMGAADNKRANAWASFGPS